MGNFGHFIWGILGHFIWGNFGNFWTILWGILDIFMGNVGHLYGKFWAFCMEEFWESLDNFMGNFGTFLLGM